MISMALPLSSPPHISLHQFPSAAINPVKNKIFFFKHCTQLPSHRPLSLQIRSCCIKNKVFEDQSQGIICYQDQSGELVCEGYDEGPRFQHTARTSYHSRDAEILDLLQQRFLEIVDGGGFNNSASKGVVAIQEDFNWNGFNKFY